MTETNGISDNYLTVNMKPQPISHWGMQKAMRYVSANLFLYQPIYEVPLPIFLMRCGSVINFFMSVIYEADGELEAAQRGEIPFTGVDPWLKRKEELFLVLKELDLYHPSIDETLDETTQFWELENKMMRDNIVTRSMLSNAQRLVLGDFLAAHQIFHRILNIPLNQERFKAIIAFEILADLEANLIEYFDDIAENTYNIYGMFVKLYGNDAPKYVAQEREHRTKIFRECVASLPENEREGFNKMFDSLSEYFYIYYLGMDGISTIKHLTLEKGKFPSPIPIPEPILENNQHSS